MLFERDAEQVAAEAMVTVGRFESPLEAQMAKGMLESAGVECALAEENINSLLGGALPVWLQVAAEDESAALELLGRSKGEAPAED